MWVETQPSAQSFDSILESYSEFQCRGLKTDVLFIKSKSLKFFLNKIFMSQKLHDWIDLI